jgi:hypothetical protein
MIITNLLANMAVVGALHTIQTNTPSFQKYAFHTMVTNAQAVATVWHLDESLMTTNQITSYAAFPTPYGIRGNIIFCKRYQFNSDFGWFGQFIDVSNHCMITETDNVETNDAILERWMRATNLLTMGKAQQLAVSSMESIGVPMEKLGFNKPTRSHQRKYEWKDGKIYPLPYYEFEWKTDQHVCRVDVSGINSNIVHFFIVGASIRLPTPTNYFEMLGLPHNPVFVRRLASQPPAYEIDESLNRKQ